MTQQDKFELIRRYKHGNTIPVADWKVSDAIDVNIIINCNELIRFIKKDLPQKPFNIIENLVKSRNYNNQLLAIELIYSELLKVNKLPK